MPPDSGGLANWAHLTHHHKGRRQSPLSEPRSPLANGGGEYGSMRQCQPVPYDINNEQHKNTAFATVWLLQSRNSR